MKYTLLKNKETSQRSVRNNLTGEVVTEMDDPKKYADLRKKALSAISRAQKDDLMKSMGLVKVKGSVSGKTYWE